MIKIGCIHASARLDAYKLPVLEREHGDRHGAGFHVRIRFVQTEEGTGKNLVGVAGRCDDSTFKVISFTSFQHAERLLRRGR